MAPDAVMSPDDAIAMALRAAMLTRGTFAKPKSRSFAPDAVTMMLPGFRSRWTIPALCAARSADAICVA